MIKTFNDVLEIKNGKNQRSVESPNGIYPIYGSGGIMGRADDFICHKDTVIIGRKGSINNPIFVNEPFWNVDTAFGLEADQKQLLPKYLFYFCMKFNFERLNKAVTIPSLTKSDLLMIEIELPDMEKQKKVVDELVLLEQIMDTRKQQIEKFDTLIKARFVEMFGNPINNSKNLNECDFIDVVKLQRGFDLPVQSRNQLGKVPVFGSNGILDYHDISKITNGGVITGRSGTIGKVYYTLDDYWPLNTTLFSVDLHGNNPIYLAYLLEMFDLKRFADGTGVPTLNRNNVHNKKIINVDIGLQNQFATFVQQVDKSKVAVQKSLDEAQLLFDSLMQQYFG